MTVGSLLCFLEIVNKSLCKLAALAWPLHAGQTLHAIVGKMSHDENKCEPNKCKSFL